MDGRGADAADAVPRPTGAVGAPRGASSVDRGVLAQDDRALADAADTESDDAATQARWAWRLLDLAEVGVRGADREARARIDDALALDPALADAWLARARALALAGDWAAAPAAVERAAGGDPAVAARAVDAAVGWAAGLAERGEWAAALLLWRTAAAADPARARPPLVAVLRAEQDVLLDQPRWSWVVRPPAPDRERALRYAAAAFVAAVACLLGFVLLAGRDETLLLSLLPCLGMVALPVLVLLLGRRRARWRAAPNPAEVAAIRADPARVFRGNPPLPLVLAALEYVAAEKQGQAIARANPWLLGRRSPSERQARRGALLRAPWMPRGGDGGGPPRR
jgi:hypothetical protein